MAWERRVNLLGEYSYYLHGDGFYISYNPYCTLILSDEGSETAIVTENDYFILNGDFRKEYEQLVPSGLEACLEFFRQNNHRSSWSD